MRQTCCLRGLDRERAPPVARPRMRTDGLKLRSERGVAACSIAFSCASVAAAVVLSTDVRFLAPLK